jgi:TonB family protein
VRSQRRSLLDLEGADEEQPQSDDRSILGLSRAPVATKPASPKPASPKPGAPPPVAVTPEARAEAQPPHPEAHPVVEVPEFERDLEERVRRPIPFERAVLFSMAAHLIILLFILLAPPGAFRGRGLLAAFLPREDPQENIPIVFREAPGPARDNPRRGEPSDKTRRAGGGDPSKSKSDSPFVPPQRGLEGLAPGSRGRQPSASAPMPPAPPAVAEKGPAAAPGERFPSATDAFPVPPPGATSSGQSPRLTGLDSAIRDAAKAAAGTGQNGGGFPNPDGGFVDSGPLSFDTKWYDWGPYAEEMIRRIKLHWEIPELARLGWKGRLTIRFFIMSDGRVEAAHVVAQSGIPPFDFAALQAILKSNPFRPLPKDLLAQVPGKDREGITVTFFYNMRPEEEKGK